MAKQYIKKVSVVNTTYFKKLKIDPAKLTLAQRNYTDKLITLIKPASNRFLKEGIWQLVNDFVNQTNGKDRLFIQNSFRSIQLQINHHLEGKGDSHKEYKFDINEYSNCELIDRLVVLAEEGKVSVGGGFSEEEFAAAKKEEEEKIARKRMEILFNPWRSLNQEEHDKYVFGLDIVELDREITYQDYCQSMAEDINAEQGIANTKWALNGCDVWKMEKDGLEVKDILFLKKR